MLHIIYFFLQLLMLPHPFLDAGFLFHIFLLRLHFHPSQQRILFPIKPPGKRLLFFSVIFVVLPPDCMDFFSVTKKSTLVTPAPTAASRNCQIRRFQENPYNRHDQAVGHEYQDGIKQVLEKLTETAQITRKPINRYVNVCIAISFLFP